MTTSLSVLRGCRGAIHKVASGLSAEQRLIVPDGFDNNIAWNIGHIIVVSQRVVYQRAGVPISLTEDFVDMYLPGTSPADWSKAPDTDELLVMLMDDQQKLESDYAAGRFSGTFEGFTAPSSGIKVDDVEGAFVFDAYHQAQHYGMILAINNFVGA